MCLYITLHYITLHYTTLHYITLHYIHMLQYIFTCICIHWCSSIYQWVVTRKTFAKDQLRCTSKYHLHPGDLGSIYVRYTYIYIILYVGTNMHICKLYICIISYICIYIYNGLCKSRLIFPSCCLLLWALVPRE